MNKSRRDLIKSEEAILVDTAYCIEHKEEIRELIDLTGGIDHESKWLPTPEIGYKFIDIVNGKAPRMDPCKIEKVRSRLCNRIIEYRHRMGMKL